MNTHNNQYAVYIVFKTKKNRLFVLHKFEVCDKQPGSDEEDTMDSRNLPRVPPIPKAVNEAIIPGEKEHMLILMIANPTAHLMNFQAA